MRGGSRKQMDTAVGRVRETEGHSSEGRVRETDGHSSGEGQGNRGTQQ